MARRPRKWVAKSAVLKRHEQLAPQPRPASPPPRQRLHNLPTQLTSFIGREPEIADITRLLESTRLLTLTGSGGCGKTRLALQVAASLVDRYPDGVWLVEFAPLSDPTLVPKTVAVALDVPEPANRPLTETLTTYLRLKKILLLLDNCEHLRAACGNLIETLLRTCPNLWLLTTSREVLGVEGELTYRVPSLRLPDPRRAPPLAQLAEYDAIRLFTERVALSQPQFTLTERNAPSITEICQRLDGIPLAIEFAAARVKVLSIEQIAARLDDRFRLLTAGSPKNLARHQTLRAAMDWSYDLLSQHERMLLRRLSVFAGGCMLDAAEAVCAGDGVRESDILDLLTRLVDKSLVEVDTKGGQARYLLLETVRQYGRDRLIEAGEDADVQRRGRDWYMTLTEQAEPELHGPRTEMWFERLEVEHDNLRAALEWSHTEKDGAEAELRLAAVLSWFWIVRGHWSEGRRWLEGALARSSDVPPTTLPKALQGAALLAERQGDYERSLALAEKGVALCRELVDRENGALLLLWLGTIRMLQGDYARAMMLFQESVGMCQELGKKWLSSWAVSRLGDLARLQGDYEQAAALHMQSLALARDAGDRISTVMRLLYLGMDTLRQGDHRRATGYFKESLAGSRELGVRWVTAECLKGLGGVDYAQRHYGKAARLFGAAEVLCKALGWHPYPPDQAYHDECLASTRAALEDTVFAAAWAEGAAMTLEQAVEYALAATDAVSTGDTKRPTSEGRPGLLTAREREVAGLIARGLSNREIAALLVISERTAESHVQHILGKLEFSSRGRIAAWAVEQGLHTPPNRS